MVRVIGPDSEYPGRENAANMVLSIATRGGISGGIRVGAV